MSAKPLSLLFDKYFLFLDRRDCRVLPVFPERDEQSLHFRRAGNLDVFAVESDHVAHVHSVGVCAAK
jgi:hypothetical protein